MNRLCPICQQKRIDHALNMCEECEQVRQGAFDKFQRDLFELRNNASELYFQSVKQNAEKFRMQLEMHNKIMAIVIVVEIILVILLVGSLLYVPFVNGS